MVIATVNKRILLVLVYSVLFYSLDAVARSDNGVQSEQFTVEISDRYRWLENLESKETKDFIQKQNRITDSYFSESIKVSKYKNELQKLVGSGFPGRPQWYGDRWVTRSFDQHFQSVWTYQKSLDDEPKLLVNEASLNAGGQIKWSSLSPDGKILAYSVVVSGGDLEEIRFYDVVARDNLAEKLEGIKFTYPSWGKTSEVIFYSRYLKPGNTSQDGIDREPVVAYHRIGTDQSQDVILQGGKGNENDGDIYSLTIDAKGKYLLVAHNKMDQYTFAYTLYNLSDPMALDNTSNPISLNVDPTSQVTYFGVLDNRLLFVHRDNTTTNGQIIAIEEKDLTQWSILIEPSALVIKNAKIANNVIVVQGLLDVKSDLRLHDKSGKFVDNIPLPAPGSVFGLSTSPIHDQIHFGFDSFTYPQSSYTYDLANHSLTTLHKSDAEFASEDFVSKQIFVESSGGARIPVFISYRKDTKFPAPLLLDVYGVGGTLSEPMFRSEWGAWMKSGGVFVMANVRGGGAYGPKWAEAGHRENRHNTHDDLIYVSEYLIESNFTSTDQLVISGASAGGMLVAAVAAKRPRLFAAVVPSVPVTDLIRFAEYTAGARLKSIMGDPKVPNELLWLLSWSPYQNIRTGVCYPATFIDTAIDDDLVHPSQAYKYAALLQEYQGCDKPILLMIAPKGGHYAASVYSEDGVGILARRLAFIADMTNLEMK